MSNTAELEELLREKFACLEKEYSLETQADEKFRLKHKIEETKKELAQLKSSPTVRGDAPCFLSRYVPSYNPEQMIGRRDLLRTIHAHLTNGNQVALVNGIGGIGKTTVAQAYITLPEYAACYHHIAWVSVFGSIRDDMLRELATDATGFEYQPNEDPAANFQRLIDCLQRISGVNLLILDNANNADDLIAVKKQIHALRWKTLFTSRATLPQGVYPTVPVEKLSPDDAAALFRRFYRKPIDENLLAHVLAKIEYHTLLTELLAKAGNENPALNLQQLSDLLDAQGITAEPLQAEIFTDHQLSRQDETTLITLGNYLLKIFDAANLSDAEQQYLRYFSILPSQAEAYATLVDFFQIAEEQHTAFGKTLKALVRKGWLTEDEQGHFKMHPVIQAVIREKLRPDVQNCAVLIDKFNWKLKVYPESNPLDKKKYISYAEKMLQWIRENNKNIACLANNLGWVLTEIGDYQKALKYSLNAITILKQTVDSNPLDLLELPIIYNNIGLIYRELGDFENSLYSHFNAIAIREKLLDCDHPDLAISYNNLGSTYQKFNDFKNAFTYHSKAIDIFELVLKRTQLSLSTAYNNIGLMYHNARDLENTLKYYGKAIAIQEQVIDHNHPDLAISYNNIGEVYRELKNFDSALKYHGKAIDIREQVLDHNHLYLALSYHNIGLTYSELGDLENALKYYSRSINIEEQVLDHNHPDLAVSCFHMAQVYYNLKNYGTAQAYIDKAMAIFQGVLSAEHPYLKNVLKWQEAITNALTASRGG